MLSLTSFVILVTSVLIVNQGIVAEEASPTYFGSIQDKTQSFFESLRNKVADLFEKLYYKVYFYVEPEEELHPQKPCEGSKYRTIDGRYNNVDNPDWGRPNSTFMSLLPPKYADGVHAPRISVTGKELPSSRLVSYTFFPDENVPDPIWTLHTMQWGQIVAHDMSLTAATPQEGNEPIACCTDLNSDVPNGETNPGCYPIAIPPYDPYYSKFNQTCMSFIRAATDQDAGLSSPDRPAQQISSVTSYMDASMLYGSDPESAARLREGKGGRLLMGPKKGFPPPTACGNQSENKTCFLLGDDRDNQHPQIAVTHLLLWREHNNLATAFQRLNPHWDDETLYQESRKVVIAKYQYITYYEWLPIVVGSKNMIEKKLYYPGAKECIDDYKEDVKPHVTKDFAACAFRYAHSAIQGHLEMVQEDRQTSEVLCLSDYFSKPSVLQGNGSFDNWARGLNTQHQQTEDQYYTHEVTLKFAKNDKPFGTDLKATDIQRGRDQGLASYNDLRQRFGQPKAQEFKDFGDNMTPEDIDKLKSLYAHPDDVDCAVGTTLERHSEEALVGPTNMDIITEQLYRTRVGDSYFFENCNPCGFTPEQMNEIRKSSLSRLMCDNGDNIQSMQARGFEGITEENPLVSCNDTNKILVVDLSPWKEKDPASE